MNNPITNNVFDSRDLIEYKEFLETELVDYWNEYLQDHNPNVDDDEQMEDVDSFDEVDTNLEGFYDSFQDEIDHYEEVEQFYSELEDYVEDFKYGATIIHEDYFEEYCEEFFKEVGYLNTDIPSWIEIDWTATADNMKMDYTEIEYNRDTYYVR